MPKVLILGAAAYLGNRIANLLVQSGQHIVYGIACTHIIATQLAKQEIIPVFCPDFENDPEPYLSLIQSKNIDVVLAIASAHLHWGRVICELSHAGSDRIAANRFRGIEGPKLGLVYCSTTYVHGSSNKRVNDLDLVDIQPSTPLQDSPVSMADLALTFNFEMEKSVLRETDTLDVMVVRPSLLYGGESLTWSPFFNPILAAARRNPTSTVTVSLDCHAKPGLVHVDDAAKAFVKAIEKLPLISGTGVYPVFDLVTSQENMYEIFAAVAECVGFNGEIEWIGPGENPLAKAMCASLRGDSSRAKQLLGWEPTRLNGFVQDMDLYVAAFEAHNPVS
ncbi:hypothetical protein N7492_002346 [Penicillium capsulatum]|uniref:NAD-dependent epimerase/dehydratase domain-containing protein n=1 Tax=Penicillium capsulatum TaxID=69766 RepID=A0A9W9IL90_9EURO|nr:hypothetical protein N7492_002346 [Penicillium capsulatum]KAJ6123048.1 hypothetical protein N7512_005513 [Penicillium capsulatum]